MSTSCSLEPVNVALFGKEVFVDGLIDLEMRAYWIIQLELKSNDKRHTEEMKGRVLEILWCLYPRSVSGY